MNQFENLFLSVGAMKAGTTWVYDKLQHHPQIHVSREKEIHYFSHIAGVSNSLEPLKLKRRAKQALMKAGKQLNQGEIVISEYRDILDWYINYAADEVNDDWYMNLFAQNKIEDSSSYCADFSNLTCFLDEDGWQHVRKVAKNIKAIYILRDPVARLWSHYKFHLQFTGHDDQSNPEENFRLFKRIINKPWFVRNSMYSQNIKLLKKNLNENEFKLFYLEDISERPFEFLDQIGEFAGLNSYDYSHLDIHSRKNVTISKNIPENWMIEIENVLGDEIGFLKEEHVWHENWSGLN